MKLSDNDKVQRLVAEHTALREVWQQLGRVNANARFSDFSYGCFGEGRTSVPLAAEGPVRGESRARVILATASAAKAAIQSELEAVEQELSALGVNAAE